MLRARRHNVRSMCPHCASPSDVCDRAPCITRLARTCTHCRRAEGVCDVDPCEVRVARGAQAKPLGKPQPALVCVMCGRPGCWTDANGCPGERRIA